MLVALMQEFIWRPRIRVSQKFCSIKVKNNSPFAPGDRGASQKKKHRTPLAGDVYKKYTSAF